MPLDMPPIGLGTFRLKNDAVQQSIRKAIALGYRHIDTAAIYRNEKDIGSVLQEIYTTSQNTICRSSLFITSKLSPYDMKNPRQALLKSLTELQTGYLDLYLIHWPAVARKPAASPEHKRLRLQAWKVLNEAKEEGLVRNIGVSNFTVQHLRELEETEWGIREAVVQMEVHPWYWRDAVEIQETFVEQGILIVGYALLAEGKLLAEGCPQILDETAERLNISKVQLVLAWALKKKIGVLVKSVDEIHLEQNLEVQSLVDGLISEDCAAIDCLSRVGEEEKQCWDPRLVI